MATITPTALSLLDLNYQQATAGQGFIGTAAAGGGDTVPLIGDIVIIKLRTTGTGSVATLDSVALSSYGVDRDITVTLSATDYQEFAIRVDTRFQQTSGNTGNLNITYTSAVGLFIDAKYVRVTR